MKAHWRGHDIIYKQGEWIYVDSGTPVSADPDRKCPHCGAANRDDDCDPCIGKLPGVDNACCGHGDQGNSYVQFSNGVIVRGFTIDGLTPFSTAPTRDCAGMHEAAVRAVWEHGRDAEQLNWCVNSEEVTRIFTEAL